MANGMPPNLKVEFLKVKLTEGLSILTFYSNLSNHVLLFMQLKLFTISYTYLLLLKKFCQHDRFLRFFVSVEG